MSGEFMRRETCMHDFEPLIASPNVIGRIEVDGIEVDSTRFFR